MNRLSRYITAALLTAELATLLVANASAQENNPERQSVRALEEVIVTARRRDESLQQVPVAVTVFSGEQLQRAGIDNVEDLRYSVPSLIISSSPGGRAIPSYTLRSQRQNEGILTQDASVAIYQAEVVQARAHGMNQALFDIASVQVLKGPQGTLFGRNSTGGAILIEPQRPTSELEGKLTVGFGNYGSRNAQAVLNVPFSEALSFRAAADWTQNDGYSKNLRTGKRHDDDDSKAGRLSFTWKPNEAVEVYTMAQYVRTDDGGSVQMPVAALPVNLAAPGGPQGLLPLLFNGINPNPGCITLARGNPGGMCNYDTPNYVAEVTAQNDRNIHHVYSDIEPFSKLDRTSVTNIATFDVGAVELKNVFGYSKLDYDAFVDFDGSILPAHQTRYFVDTDQFSNEFQIIGKSLDDRLDWITGLYYFREYGRDETTTRTLDVFPTGVNNPAQGGGNMQNTSYSAFAQGSYKLDSIANGLSANVGVRYNIDKRALQTRVSNAAGCRIRDEAGVPISPCYKAVDETFRKPTWTVGLDYAINEDAMIYIAHRRGYRSGGFNMRAELPSQFEPYKPEVVDDIEVGSKVDWQLGGVRGRTNVALYHQWYNDIQRTISFNSAAGVSSTIVSSVVNAAKATVYGGELESTFYLTDALELSLSYAASIARYDSFNDVLLGDLSDFKFQGAPDHTGTVTLRYRLPMPSTLGELAVQTDYYASSAYQFADVNHPLSRQKSFDLLGFAADWQAVAGSPLDLRVFVKNALNKEYFGSGVFISTYGMINGYAGPPRTYGASLTYRFE